jgi:hypothetical protein
MSWSDPWLYPQLSGEISRQAPRSAVVARLSIADIALESATFLTSRAIKRSAARQTDPHLKSLGRLIFDIGRMI